MHMDVTACATLGNTFPLNLTCIFWSIHNEITLVETDKKKNSKKRSHHVNICIYYPYKIQFVHK